MEDFVTKSLLFDFYGELLTERQKKIYQQVVFEDFSISEIARDEGISRQGIHDLMKRCDKLLEDYEEKLHLVERFLQIRSKVGDIQILLQEQRSRKLTSRVENRESKTWQEIDRIAKSILEEL